MFSSVHSLSHVQLFLTPWTAAHQASLSITNSQSPPKPMSIESVMPSNHLILYHPLILLPSIFPSIRVFQMSQLFVSGGQSIGVSLQHQFFQGIFRTSLLGLTGLICLQSKGLWRVFSNTTALLFHSPYQLLTYYIVFVHLLKVLLPQIQCKFHEIWIFSANVQFFIQCISPFWHTVKGKERKMKSLSHVQLFATPWTVAYQAPPSMGFSRQEYWSGLPFPSPDLPDPAIEPESLAL